MKNIPILLPPLLIITITMFLIILSQAISKEVKHSFMIKADNEVTIKGIIDGDVECDSVTINKSGNVKGNIKTNTMIVEGKAEGELNVNDVLNIKSEDNVNRKIFYDEIQIEEGGKLSGEINHRDKNNKQEEFKDLKVS
jgi:cytoskeletal protein CcmA (bactofilin family)